MVKCPKCQHIYESIGLAEAGNSKICDYCGNDFVIVIPQSVPGQSGISLSDHELRNTGIHTDTKIFRHTSNKSTFIALSVVTALFVFAAMLLPVLKRLYQEIILEEQLDLKLVIAVGVIVIFLIAAAILICGIWHYHRNLWRKSSPSPKHRHL